jgi:1-phosphofructokinase
MIYTCTMNPAIDLFVEMDTFEENVVNRSKYEEYQPNGKGVNVSLILKQLSIDSTALGFLGGFSGEFIKDELDDTGIKTDFVKVDGITRINTFVQSNNGEYKIVNRGPVIDEQTQRKLLAQIEHLTSEDTLFVNGSLPRGVDSSILVEMAKLSLKKGFKVIWDISDSILKELLKYRPYLIKPNVDEFKEIFLSDKDNSEEEMIQKAIQMVDNGVENIIISNGGDGAWLINDKGVFISNAPKGKVVNTACSGDTMLATFYGIYQKTNDEIESLKTAVAAGSSTAFRPGLTDFKDVEYLKTEINVSDY